MLMWNTLAAPSDGGDGGKRRSLNRSSLRLIFSLIFLLLIFDGGNGGDGEGKRSLNRGSLRLIDITFSQFTP